MLHRLFCDEQLRRGYVASAVSASAMPAPPDHADPAAGGAATVPSQPVIVHQQASAWTYVLIAAAAVAITLAVVFLIERLRRTSARKPASPSPSAT
jgi:negative regulator of sigma E activity